MGAFVRIGNALFGMLLIGAVNAQQEPAPKAGQKDESAPTAPTAQNEQPKPPKPPASVESPKKRKSDPKRALRNARSIAQMLAASGGYGIRSAQWTGELTSDGVELISVHLFAGNEYQVVVGFDGPSAGIGAAAFDTRGKVLAAEVHRGDGSLVFELKPSRSGVHRIRLRALGEQAQSTSVTLTYVYK